MGNHHFTHGLDVEACSLRTVAKVGDDAIHVLHHLPLLEEIEPLDPQCLADQLQEVDDPEWQRGLVCAQLPMPGMVHADEAVDARCLRRGQFPPGDSLSIHTWSLPLSPQGGSLSTLARQRWPREPS